MCAFFKEFYMLVAFLDSQALQPLLTQQQQGGAHLLKHTLSCFVFKGQGLGVWLCFALVFVKKPKAGCLGGISPLIPGSAGAAHYTQHLFSFKIGSKYQTCQESINSTRGQSSAGEEVFFLENVAHSGSKRLSEEPKLKALFFSHSCPSEQQENFRLNSTMNSTKVK